MGLIYPKNLKDKLTFDIFFIVQDNLSTKSHGSTILCFKTFKFSQLLRFINNVSECVKTLKREKELKVYDPH